MLEASLIALAVFIIFLFILGVLFLIPIVIVIVNGAILYFLFLRIYTEITKYNKGNIYAISGAASVFILLITGNFLPVWWITTASLMTFIIAQIYMIIQKKR